MIKNHLKLKVTNDCILSEFIKNDNQYVYINNENKVILKEDKDWYVAEFSIENLDENSYEVNYKETFLSFIDKVGESIDIEITSFKNLFKEMVDKFKIEEDDMRDDLDTILNEYESIDLIDLVQDLL